MSTNQTQSVCVIWHYGQRGSLKHRGGGIYGLLTNGSEKNEESLTEMWKDYTYDRLKHRLEK